MLAKPCCTAHTSRRARDAEAWLDLGQRRRVLQAMQVGPRWEVRQDQHHTLIVEELPVAYAIPFRTSRLHMH